MRNRLGCPLLMHSSSCTTTVSNTTSLPSGKTTDCHNTTDYMFDEAGENIHFSSRGSSRHELILSILIHQTAAFAKERLLLAKPVAEHLPHSSVWPSNLSDLLLRKQHLICSNASESFRREKLDDRTVLYRERLNSSDQLQPLHFARILGRRSQQYGFKT